jgi:hypothetical protein
VDTPLIFAKFLLAYLRIFAGKRVINKKNVKTQWVGLGLKNSTSQI